MNIKTMRAAILVEQNQPLVVDEVELPTKLNFGQVLVKVLCSGICGSQLGEIEGIKGEDNYLPHLLGHEGTGIVLDTGEGVTTVKDGDKVKKVSFGDTTGLSIKRDDPARRKSFRARHRCDTAKDKTTARYWSCYQWRGSAKVDN